MTSTYSLKGADYALDEDQWSSFRSTAEFFGMQLHETGLFFMHQKIERLKSLRANDREPLNESVHDTYKDLAVYAVLTYAMYLEQKRTVNSVDTDGLEPGQQKTVGQEVYRTPTTGMTTISQDEINIIHHLLRVLGDSDLSFDLAEQQAADRLRERLGSLTK